MSVYKNKSGVGKVIFWGVISVVIGVVCSAMIVQAIEKPAENRTNEERITLKDRIKSLTKNIYKETGQTLGVLNFDNIIYPPRPTYFIEDPSIKPDIGAAAYVIGDVETGEIILEKNADEIFPVASITKLMTALVSLETLGQNEETKTSRKALSTLGERGQLRIGETIKVSDLLYPLLLVSSNDAAEVLAEHNGRDKFLKSMNQKASVIGMLNTNYNDPSGLSAENVSTARDLFLLSHYLQTHHRTVFDITELEKYNMSGRVYKNANRFSTRDDYIGGKTGYTDKAKRTGIAVFDTEFRDVENRNIGIVLLRTENRARDIEMILDYLKTNVIFAYAEEYHAKETETVDLTFVGDMMLDRGVKSSVYKNYRGNYDKLFNKVSFIEDADILFGNLEGPISDLGKNVGSQYSFHMEPKVAKSLKNSGFDILSFANNHVGDWSEEAFIDTLKNLTDNNILYAGAGENFEEASRPIIIEKKGIKIGYLGFSDVGPNWMQAKENSPGILLASDSKYEQIIKDAKEKVDVLVVSIHWGEEYKEHNARQEKLGKSAIDAGASIVIGHHPHVIQDIEEYKNGLIVYSLGNFIFDQHFSQATMEGLVVEAIVNKDGYVSHDETIVHLDETYRPIQETILNKISKNEKALASVKSIFEREKCPIGNTDKNYIVFNSNLENSVEDYIPNDLVEIKDKIKTKDGRNICLIRESAQALYRMYNDAKKDGVELIVTSGFRSFTTQGWLYENWNEKNDVYELKAVAEAGHSEHQLGTTVDFTSDAVDQDSASRRFDQTQEFEWLNENANEYGFVMSYPKNAETGYIYEPWHWRYLGEKTAREIAKSGLTIQEYLN